jgi:hypothetical protein
MKERKLEKSLEPVLQNPMITDHSRRLVANAKYNIFINIFKELDSD